MTIRTIIFINKLIHTQDIILAFKEISYSCPKVTPQRVVMRRNGELNFRGDDKLYAVKNIGDPINYSKDHYAVKYYANKNNVPKHAPKVTVYAKKA